MSLRREIFEQPRVLATLLQQEREHVEQLVKHLRKLDIRYVLVAARGTSLNAGRYAAHLWGMVIGWPVVLAQPSLFTVYDRPPALHSALVVGVSQSGRSPDIVRVVEEGRRQGCFTLAITNDPNAPLAHVADEVIPLHAGVERAVAATKTYTAQLSVIAMLAAAWQKEMKLWNQLQTVPEWVDAALGVENDVAHLTLRYRFMQRCVMLGRGYDLATAFEWALKVKELTYVQAEPFSTADFQHGPMALVDSGFPVFAVVSSGPVLQKTNEFLARLRNQLAADITVLSNHEEALEIAHAALRIPVSVPEWLTPLVSIVPAQLFAYYLTRVRASAPLSSPSRRGNALAGILIKAYTLGVRLFVGLSQAPRGSPALVRGVQNGEPYTNPTTMSDPFVPFEELSHTAEELDRVPAEHERSLEVTSLDLESLLVDWLTELLVIFNTTGEMVTRAEVLEMNDTALKARVWAGRAPFEPYEDIKAVTYHGLHVERKNGFWEATIVFDV